MKREEFAELIQKGRAEFPETKHGRGAFMRGMIRRERRCVPVEACAIGFAMLGSMGEKAIERERHGPWWRLVLMEAEHVEGWEHAIIEHNDWERWPLDDIVFWLKTGQEPLE